MALGKTVSYQPFNETSIGYGSNEIATAHSTEFPNGTDTVRVTIEHLSGNWDTTGHLATPSVGTAVATYHKQQEYWTVKGERDDVDAVLAAMSFFPADKEETRTWTPTALKDNQTSGTYADEEPPTIGDTAFTVRVYDGITQVSTQTLTFSVTEAVFGNQRPYWSVAPTAEDLNTSSHSSVAGGLLDLGTISHGSDTENVRVKCQFRHHGFSNYTTGALGAITLDHNIYIGDKKPATSDTQEARFDFTGSVAEAQAFLDNVRYYDAGNQETFDMFLTVTDGVVGSTLTKTCYFSNNVVTVSTVPDVHYVEDDNPAYWDFGYLNFGYGNMREVNTFTATITLDATGIANTSSINTSGTGVTQNYYSGTGVFEISSNSTVNLRNALRNIRYTPIVDANSAFTMTVDFTFSSSTVGSSYSSTQQTINVTAQDLSEVSNLTTTHTWTEDKWYDFPIANMPQIIHGRNDNFDVIFTLSDADAGVLGRHVTSGTAFFTSSYGTSAQYKLQGTRDEVNEALNNLYFAPNADYDSDFTISFTVDRTSGDLTYETQSTGSFTMNAIATDEISFPLERPHITWRNNVSTDFQSGLQILDTADNVAGSSNFGSTYTVKMLLRQLYDHGASGFAFDQGVLKIKDVYVDLLDTVVDNRTNFVTITGNKDAVNVALKNLTFIPDPLYAERNRHYVVYEVTRDADGVVLQNYSSSVLTWIDNAIITAPYSITTQLFDWTEDTPFEFDTEFRITENVTANADYTPANGYDSWYGGWYKVTIRGKYWDGSNAQELADINFTTTTAPNGFLMISGSGTVSDPLVLQGSKAELNKAFATMKMTPTTPDFTSAPSSNGSFWIEHKLERMRDSSVIINYNEQLGRFNAGTDTSEYKTTWTNVEYIEDIKAQYIFSHLENVIEDGAGDLFNPTYDVSIRLANETTGKFEAYVNEGYLLDDELNIFVNDYEVRLVGTKEEINEAIKNIQFSPYADVNTNVDIHYTQKRTYNNSTVTHANDVVVTTMIGNDVPDYIVASQFNNIQLFVQDEFLIGVDLTNSQDYDINRNAQVDQDILDENAFVTLSPGQLRRNEQRSKVFTAPIEVKDSYEDGGPSLYKVVFDNGSISAILGASLNITDTGWMTKSELNQLLKDGIYVTGVSIANNNVPEHGEIFEVSFEVKRKTATGAITILPGPSNTLQYKFMSGITAYLQEGVNGGQTSIARLDNKTTDYDLYQYTKGFFVGRRKIEFRQAGSLQSSFILPDGSSYYKGRYPGGRSMQLYGRIYDVTNDVWSTYNEVEVFYPHPYLPHTDSSVWHQLNIGNAIIKVQLADEEQIVINGRSDLHPAYPHNDWIFRGEKASDTNTRNQISLFVWSEWGAFLRVGSTKSVGDEAKLFINDTTYDSSDF